MQTHKPLQGRSTVLLSFMVATAFSPLAVADPESTSEPPQQPLTSPALVPEGTSTNHSHRVRRLTSFIQRRYGVPQLKATAIVNSALDHGRTFAVEPELILALIAVESTFNERAISPRGARGLMQVMPGPHAKRVRALGGIPALFDPHKNIHAGTGIFRKYLNLSRNNMRKALLFYNGSYGTRSAFPDRVLRIYADLKAASLPTVVYAPSSERSRDGPM